VKETISWLLAIEHLAGAFYRKVAERFAEDENYSKFFLHLSAEEAWHAKVMERASKSLVHQ
jgi:rubrerythrin